MGAVKITEQRYDMLVRISGMPPATGGTCTLMQFLPSNGTQNAYDAALRYVANARQCEGLSGEYDHHFITFIGEPGRGKTHLALGIGWQWLGTDMGSIRYWQVSEFLDAIRNEYDHPPRDSHGGHVPGVFDQARVCTLLILDDLGVEKSTEWAIDKLDTLVNHRWVEGLQTVFTTNLAPSQLQPRIRSRIREGVTVTLGGPDYRELKAKIRRGEER